MSSLVSPNLVEPELKIIDEVSYIVCIVPNEPVPDTVKSELIMIGLLVVLPLVVTSCNVSFDVD